MTIRLNKNPYRGINAHFNSYLQSQRGSWVPFHHDHITYLKSAINRNLPPGYYALAEKSLQIRLEDEKPDFTRPDVTILQHEKPPPHISPTPQEQPVPTLQIALEAAEEELHAVEIYHTETGKFVTHLELLSPSNKTAPKGYLEMRSAMVAYGVNMVELDYLHTISPLHAALADYTHHEEHAYPYSITVTNIWQRAIGFYCFYVDDPIPTIPIPLRGEETFSLDFNAIYNTTFEDDPRVRFVVDYELPPAHFETYSPADQARILAVMERLKTEAIP